MRYEALRLAVLGSFRGGLTLGEVQEAEDELNRLIAQRDALLKMLKDVLPVAEDASESLGRFCSDEGWAQEDMDRMDNVDGMLPLIRAAIKAAEENT